MAIPSRSWLLGLLHHTDSNGQYVCSSVLPQAETKPAGEEYNILDRRTVPKVTLKPAAAYVRFGS